MNANLFSPSSVEGRGQIYSWPDFSIHNLFVSKLEFHFQNWNIETLEHLDDWKNNLQTAADIDPHFHDLHWQLIWGASIEPVVRCLIFSTTAWYSLAWKKYRKVKKVKSPNSVLVQEHLFLTKLFSFTFVTKTITMYDHILKLFWKNFPITWKKIKTISEPKSMRFCLKLYFCASLRLPGGVLVEKGR